LPAVVHEKVDPRWTVTGGCAGQRSQLGRKHRRGGIPDDTQGDAAVYDRPGELDARIGERAALVGGTPGVVRGEAEDGDLLDTESAAVFKEIQATANSGPVPIADMEAPFAGPAPVAVGDESDMPRDPGKF
jgi:hypothetical protein